MQVSNNDKRINLSSIIYYEGVPRNIRVICISRPTHESKMDKLIVKQVIENLSLSIRLLKQAIQTPETNPEINQALAKGADNLLIANLETLKTTFTCKRN